MKLLTLQIMLLFLALSGSAFAEEPKSQWVEAIKKLFGTWDSISVKGMGDDTRLQMTFGSDGSIRTKMIKGRFEDVNQGVYTVGKSHIYFWTGGPPDGVEVEDPEEHSQAMLMTYQFADGNLKLTILDGADRAVAVLKKTKAEQGGARRPATAGDSKSKGSEKPKPESEERSH